MEIRKNIQNVEGALRALGCLLMLRGPNRDFSDLDILKVGNPRNCRLGFIANALLLEIPGRFGD